MHKQDSEHGIPKSGLYGLFVASRMFLLHSHGVVADINER
jgi:hypothetical protein